MSAPASRYERLFTVLDFVGVALLAGAVTALGILWQRVSPVPPAGDTADHLLKSLTLYYGVTTGGLADRLESVLAWRDYYPPLTYGITSLFYLAGGTSMTSALASQGVLVFILVASLFSFARRNWGRVTAWVVALLGGTAPLLLVNVRFYFLELAEACWLAASIELLARSDTFRNRKYSILFGVAIAAGCLTKWTFLWFAVPPLLVTALLALPRTAEGLVRSLRLLAYPVLLAASFLVMKRFYFHDFHGPFTPAPGIAYHLYFLFAALSVMLYFLVRRSRPGEEGAANFLLSLLPALALAWPWYLQNLDLMLEKMGTHGRTYPLEQNLQQAAPQHLAVLANELVLLMPYLLLAGLVFLAFRKEDRRRLAPLLAGAAVGLTVTVLVMPMGDRYCLPALPFLAILGLSWLHHLRWGARVALVLALALSLWQLGGWVAFSRTGLEKRLIDAKLSVRVHPAIGFIPAKIENHLFSVAVFPAPGRDFALDAVVREVARVTGDRASKVALVTQNLSTLKEETFQYYSMAARLPLFFYRVETREQRYFGDILSLRRYERALRKAGMLDGSLPFDAVPEGALVVIFRDEKEKAAALSLAAASMPPVDSLQMERKLPDGLALELYRLVTGQKVPSPR